MKEIPIAVVGVNVVVVVVVVVVVGGGCCTPLTVTMSGSHSFQSTVKPHKFRCKSLMTFYSTTENKAVIFLICTVCILLPYVLKNKKRLPPQSPELFCLKFP